MGIKFANNASTNITHALTADATSVSVTPGTGDLFPSIVEGKDYFYATLAGNNGLEIVKVTKRVLDTMTIERAQDGTYALIFNQGDLFELRIVAADFEDTFSHVETTLEDTVDALNASVDNKMSSYLPLSGGTMTDIIRFENPGWSEHAGDIGGAIGNNGNMLRIAGGPMGATVAGGYIQLYARNHTTRPGSVVLCAQNTEQTSPWLELTPSGYFGLGGNRILTSAGGTLNSGSSIYGREGVIQSDINTATIWISGGKTATNNPYIQLFGGSREGGTAGRIDLVAQNALGGKKMVFSLVPATDKITLNGNDILTSAGGKVTSLTISGGWQAIKRTDDTAYLEIFGGSTSDNIGGAITLFGKDHVGWESGPGGVNIRASNDSNTAHLFFKADGTFQLYKKDGWTTKVLTSAGGEVGTLVDTSGTGMHRNVNNSFLAFHGGKSNSWGDGALLELSGADRNNNNGRFILSARQGDTASSLAGTPTGNLTWGTKPVLTLVNSWKDDNGNWYRKYSDGWIEQGGRIAGTTTSGTVNFPIAFTNTNYTMTIGQYMGSSTDTEGVAASTLISNYTTTSFRYSTTSQRDDNWYACGF